MTVEEIKETVRTGLRQGMTRKAAAAAARILWRLEREQRQSKAELDKMEREDPTGEVHAIREQTDYFADVYSHVEQAAGPDKIQLVGPTTSYLLSARHVDGGLHVELRDQVEELAEKVRDCVAGTGLVFPVSPYTRERRLALEARRMAARKLLRRGRRPARNFGRRAHRVGSFNTSKRRSTSTGSTRSAVSCRDPGGGESGGDPPQSDEGDPATFLRRAGAVCLLRGPPGEATGRKRADVPSRLRDVARKP